MFKNKPLIKVVMITEIIFKTRKKMGKKVLTGCASVFDPEKITCCAVPNQPIMSDLT